VFRALIRWWHRRQRAVDLGLLWPECRKQSPNLTVARAAFAVHAFNDPAWLELGDEKIIETIDELT